MNTETQNAIAATDKDAQYDERAKRLLGHKYILAYILINTINDFRGMDPKDAVTHIQGEPFIGTIPLEPGLTNMAEKEQGQRIIGFYSENTEINEGLVRFDIAFYVRIKDNLLCKPPDLLSKRKRFCQYQL